MTASELDPEARVLLVAAGGVRELAAGEALRGLAPDKLEAFLGTHYLVHGAPALRLVVGERCAGLAELHRRRGVAASVFVTAWNPGGEAAGPEANARRQAELESELDARGLEWLPGEGAHPTNDWPPERSALVLGIGLTEAAALGRRFGQAAVVWCDEGALPRLVVIGEE